MTNKATRVPWLRLIAEATAIVLSILLALGVDEWRDAARDRDLEREYLQRLVAHLDANLAVVSQNAIEGCGSCRRVEGPYNAPAVVSAA